MELDLTPGPVSGAPLCIPREGLPRGRSRGRGATRASINKLKHEQGPGWFSGWIKRPLIRELFRLPPNRARSPSY